MSAPAPIPPAPQAPAPSQRKKPHVLGIIALAAAVVGFIFACVPGALIVGWVLLPIAFILSIVALFLKGSKWPAITGLVIAVVGTVVGFVVFFALIAHSAQTAFDDAAGSSAGSSVSAGSTAAATPDKADAPASQYTVVIGDATQGADYSGKPALIVHYTFTNNSAKDANFMTSVSAKAFQEGVELDTAIVTDSGFDSTALLKDIKPGTTLEVAEAYVLSGTSDVNVEVKKLFSLDDAKLATKTFTVK